MRNFIFGIHGLFSAQLRRFAIVGLLALTAYGSAGCLAVPNLECMNAVTINATFIHSSVSTSADTDFNATGDFHLAYSASELPFGYDSFSSLDNLFGTGKGVAVSKGQASISYTVPGSGQTDSNGNPTVCVLGHDIQPTTLQFQSGSLTVAALPNTTADGNPASITYSFPTGYAVTVNAVFDLDQPTQPAPQWDLSN